MAEILTPLKTLLLKYHNRQSQKIKTHQSIFGRTDYAALKLPDSQNKP